MGLAVVAGGLTFGVAELSIGPGSTENVVLGCGLVDVTSAVGGAVGGRVTSPTSEATGDGDGDGDSEPVAEAVGPTTPPSISASAEAAANLRARLMFMPTKSPQLCRYIRYPEAIRCHR